MRIVGIREAQQQLSGLVDEAQSGTVVLTRHGRPAAILRGIVGRKLEDVVTENDDKFWREIEAARNSPTYSEEEVMQTLRLRKKRGTRQK